jgi:AmmeMemoRadiSam system protein A
MQNDECRMEDRAPTASSSILHSSFCILHFFPIAHVLELRSMFLRPEHQAALLDEARRTIRRALDAAEDAPPEPATDRAAPDPALLRPAGCFVSLHALESHRLRGCVGRLDAVKPLLHAVRHAARGVLDDPRFRHCPVCVDELAELEIEISVLSPLCPADGPEAFDLLNDGIYLTCQGRSGCFLPQVARETGWPRERLLARLCTEKLGLAGDAWQRHDARLETFTTLILGPEPFVPHSAARY